MKSGHVERIGYLLRRHQASQALHMELLGLVTEIIAGERADMKAQILALTKLRADAILAGLEAVLMGEIEAAKPDRDQAQSLRSEKDCANAAFADVVRKECARIGHPFAEDAAEETVLGLIRLNRNQVWNESNTMHKVSIEQRDAYMRAAIKTLNDGLAAT